MIRMIQRFILTLGLLSVCLIAHPQSAAAYDPFGGVNCSGQAANTAVCTDKNSGSTDPVSGSNGILYKTTNIIAIIAGVAAVIVLLISSINYLTAAGDSSKISSAKNTIIYTLVGLVVIVIVRTIVVFVINKVG